MPTSELAPPVVEPPSSSAMTAGPPVELYDYISTEMCRLTPVKDGRAVGTGLCPAISC